MSCAKRDLFNVFDMLYVYYNILRNVVLFFPVLLCSGIKQAANDITWLDIESINPFLVKCRSLLLFQMFAFRLHQGITSSDEEAERRKLSFTFIADKHENVVWLQGGLCLFQPPSSGMLQLFGNQISEWCSAGA